MWWLFLVDVGETHIKIVYVWNHLQNITFFFYESINFCLWSRLNNFFQVQEANIQLNP